MLDINSKILALILNIRGDKLINESKILITGGTGSFGKWMTKRLLEMNAKKIVIFSRDEQKQELMQREFCNFDNIDYIIGDIRNYDSINDSLKGIDIVYHAAAMKIITACERHPIECLKTNVLGTNNVSLASKKNDVKKSILISTDKSVKPINFYGMSKGMAEKIFLSNYLSKTSFNVVRYGNVIGSRGSVIPYFKELITSNKPLKITSKEMTRFLITLDEAIDLVIKATLLDYNNCIFVPDIPSCNILDLAISMGGVNYPIEYMGIRPGEKIHECLINEEEMRRTIKKDNYYVIMPFGKYDGGKEEEYISSSNLLNAEDIKGILKNCG